MRVSRFARLRAAATLVGLIFATPSMWVASAAAEAGCMPYGYCAAPSSQYSSYTVVQTGYVVHYRPVRVSGPAVYGYRAMRNSHCLSPV